MSNTLVGTGPPQTVRLRTGDDASSVVSIEIARRYTSTSHVDVHSHIGDTPQRGVRCRACRWFVATLLVTTTGDLVVQTIGQTVVRGETVRYRVARGRDVCELLDALVVRRGTDRAFLPAQILDVFDLLADEDEDVSVALDNWLDSPTNQEIVERG